MSTHRDKSYAVKDTEWMDPTIKAEWIRRLRSGDYEQGKAALKQITLDGTAKHCCLGVLSEQAAEAGVCTPDMNRIGSVYFDGHISFLPVSVAHWARLGSSPTFWGIEDRDGDPISLVSMNDAGFTFDQIADMIEWGL